MPERVKIVGEGGMAGKTVSAGISLAIVSRLLTHMDVECQNKSAFHAVNNKSSFIG
jgi:hypothetical protein